MNVNADKRRECHNLVSLSFAIDNARMLSAFVVDVATCCDARVCGFCCVSYMQIYVSEKNRMCVTRMAVPATIYEQMNAATHKERKDAREEIRQQKSL